jgi:hypothetical protein
MKQAALSIYPANVGSCANKSIIRFAKDAVPPVEAFWSITLYDDEGFQVANPIHQFAVSRRMPLKRDGDGSLTLYFQNDDPGTDREANWLPAPKGPFNLSMRLYAPKSEALTRRSSSGSVRPMTASDDRRPAARHHMSGNRSFLRILFV